LFSSLFFCSVVVVVVSVCGGGGGAEVVVVEVVSVDGGGGCGCVFCGGGAGCCSCRRGSVFVMTMRDCEPAPLDPLVMGGGGAVVIRGGAGMPGVVTGIVPAIVPGVAVPVVSTFGDNVKLLVVSALVFVIGGVASPGALMVEVTPLAWPSDTTS